MPKSGRKIASENKMKRAANMRESNVNVIHADISDEANWRSVCGKKPNKDGTNLSLADNQVTCKDCLKRLGYEV